VQIHSIFTFEIGTAEEGCRRQRLSQKFRGACFPKSVWPPVFCPKFWTKNDESYTFSKRSGTSLALDDPAAFVSNLFWSRLLLVEKFTSTLLISKFEKHTLEIGFHSKSVREPFHQKSVRGLFFKKCTRAFFSKSVRPLLTSKLEKYTLELRFGYKSVREPFHQNAYSPFFSKKCTVRMQIIDTHGSVNSTQH
jgi:hypothetical protein